MKKSNSSNLSSGFTIVELLVVIVVIGILAAITIVSYTGITAKANIASLQSDLTNNSKKLKMYYTLYGYYPNLDANKCPEAPSTIDNNYCLKASSGNTLTYTSVAPITFHLNATKNNASYSINSNTSPAIATSVAGSPVGSACPTGFIPVPGSGTYGTNDFCVMKYEAKADDNSDGIGDTNQTTGNNTWPANTHPISATRKLVSTPQGYPVARISQTTAINVAPLYTANCDTGCHLMTEAEWLTIAQNVLSVNTNWSNNTIGGTNYIYSGHNNDIPTGAQVADSSDANGYAGTNSALNQRRTLTLSNNQVIWDLAGNVSELTSGTVQSPTIQPGITGDGWGWRDWNAATTTGTLPVNPFPSYGTPAASGWDSATNGIGAVYSSSDETGLRGFMHGGDWWTDYYAGVLALSFDALTSDIGSPLGFRVSR